MGFTVEHKALEQALRRLLEEPTVLHGVRFLNGGHVEFMVGETERVFVLRARGLWSYDVFSLDNLDLPLELGRSLLRRLEAVARRESAEFLQEATAPAGEMEGRRV